VKVGDLVRYSGTGALYLCVWSDERYCKLLGFPNNQVFKIDECELEVISENR
jgi:hypothetical protein